MADAWTSCSARTPTRATIRATGTSSSLNSAGCWCDSSFLTGPAKTSPDLHLECLDSVEPPQRLSPVEAVAALDEITAEMSIVPKFWTDYAVSQRGRGEVNSFEHMADRKVSGVSLGGAATSMHTGSAGSR